MTRSLALFLTSVSLLLATAAGPALAAPGLFGEPGLLLVPTADYEARGDYSFGINTVDEGYRGSYPHQGSLSGNRATVLHYYNVGLLPRVDVSLGFVNLEGKLFAKYHNPYSDPIAVQSDGRRWGGWYMDRFLSARWQVVTQGRRTPALAVGYRDLTGTSLWSSRYLVLSRRFGASSTGKLPRPGLGLHVGYGDAPRRHPGSHGDLDGPFAGVDYSPTPRVGLMLEATREHVNLGARISVTRHLQLQPSFMGLKWLGGGVSLTSRM